MRPERFVAIWEDYELFLSGIIAEFFCRISR
jgi:hypothetical protein